MRIVMTLSNPFVTDPRPYKEAKSLVNQGCKVTVLCWDRELKYKKKEVVDGIRIERIRLKAGYGFKAVFLKISVFWLLLFFKAIRKDFDIIYSHDFDTAIVGYLLKIFKRKKWIYDCHDLYFTFFMMEGRKESLITKIVEKIDLFLARKSDLLIVPTKSIGGRYEGIKEYYQKNKVKKILTIWNVPKMENFLKYENLKLKKQKEYTIGFVGNLRTINNFILLFMAVEKLGKNYRIILIGDGLKRKILEKESKKYKIKIDFVGKIKYSLIPNYYKICDAIYSFFPPRLNVSRGLATKIFEAAILGIPVITNEESLMGDFVKKYKCGITIKQATIDELKKAIIKLKKIKFDPKEIRKEWRWEIEERKLLEKVLS